MTKYTDIINRLTELDNSLIKAGKTLKTIETEVTQSFFRDFGLTTPASKTPTTKPSKVSWADQMDDDNNEKTTTKTVTKNAWNTVVSGGKIVRGITTDAPLVTVPVDGASFNVEAYIIKNLAQAEAPEFTNRICYIERYKVFVYHSPIFGTVFGNGINVDNRSSSLSHTTMCRNRGNCKVPHCAYAHSPFDVDAITTFAVRSEPYYNSNSIRMHNRVSPIPLLGISNVDDDLSYPDHRFDILHRYGRFMMNYILISSHLARKFSLNYMHSYTNN